MNHRNVRKHRLHLKGSAQQIKEAKADSAALPSHRKERPPPPLPPPPRNTAIHRNILSSLDSSQDISVSDLATVATILQLRTHKNKKREKKKRRKQRKNNRRKPHPKACSPYFLGVIPLTGEDIYIQLTYMEDSIPIVLLFDEFWEKKNHSQL